LALHSVTVQNISYGDLQLHPVLRNQFSQWRGAAIGFLKVRRLFVPDSVPLASWPPPSSPSLDEAVAGGERAKEEDEEGKVYRFLKITNLKNLQSDWCYFYCSTRNNLLFFRQVSVCPSTFPYIFEFAGRLFRKCRTSRRKEFIKKYFRTSLALYSETLSRTYRVATGDSTWSCKRSFRSDAAGRAAPSSSEPGCFSRPVFRPVVFAACFSFHVCSPSRCSWYMISCTAVRGVFAWFFAWDAHFFTRAHSSKRASMLTYDILPNRGLHLWCFDISITSRCGIQNLSHKCGNNARVAPRSEESL